MIWNLEFKLIGLLGKKNMFENCKSSSKGKSKMVCLAESQNLLIVGRAQRQGEERRPSPLSFPAPFLFHTRLVAFWCSQGFCLLTSLWSRPFSFRAHPEAGRTKDSLCPPTTYAFVVTPVGAVSSALCPGADFNAYFYT